MAAPSGSGREMGLGKLNLPNTCFKRKYRWFVKFDDIDYADILPPNKTARPTLSFKEMEAQHLNETIYFPGKPDWKPINLTLYDIQKGTDNVIWKQLLKLYDPKEGKYETSCIEGIGGFKFNEMKVGMLDGCGETIEVWVFENPYFQEVNWGELDMTASDVVYVDVTIRYDRAYVQNEEGQSEENNQEDLQKVQSSTVELQRVQSSTGNN